MQSLADTPANAVPHRQRLRRAGPGERARRRGPARLDGASGSCRARAIRWRRKRRTSAAGQARHLPVHERRPVARRHLRPQAGAGEIRTAKRRAGTTASRPSAQRRQADAVAVQVSEVRPERHRGQRALSRTSARCIDDICVIRSMHTDNPNHEPSLLMMNSGNMQPTRPSMGSWLTYGLGTENQNLPGLRRPLSRQAGRRPAAVEQQLPARHLPGHAHQQLVASIRRRVIAHVDNRYLPHGAQRAPARPAAADERGCTCSERGRDDQLEARIASLEMAFRMQIEAQEAFDLDTRDDGRRAQLLRRGRVRRRLPDRPPAGRARRAHDADLLRQRPAVGRSRRHPQPPQPRPAERPADRRAAERPESRAACSTTRW